MIDLLDHRVRQRQAAHDGLLVRWQIGIENRARANVCGFPELSVAPDSAGEEVEAALVAADLIGAEEDAILVADEEFARRVAARADLAHHPSRSATIEIEI